MIHVSNKFNINDLVHPNSMDASVIMCVVAIRVAVFPLRVDVSYQCVDSRDNSSNHVWYFREDELSSASRPPREVNISVVQKSLFD